MYVTVNNLTEDLAGNNNNKNNNNKLFYCILYLRVSLDNTGQYVSVLYARYFILTDEKADNLCMSMMICYYRNM